MMDNNELSEFIQRSESLLDHSPQMDEQNTRRKIIEPFLELLGWDMLSTEVELEYSVPMGAGTKKVDYALLLDDKPVIFVEAKGVDSTISDSHRKQLKSYIRQTGVNWGILTNGENIEIFKRRTEGSLPDEVSLGQLSIDELSENTNLLNAVSREYIKSGEAENIASQIETSRKAAENLRDKKDEISTGITNLITDEIGESVSQTIETGAKQFVDVLAVTLEEQEQEELSFEGDPTSTQSTVTTSTWTPNQGANAISGRISRRELQGNDSDLVAVFPSKKSGIPFLKENNAWGFVRIGKNPEYVAVYVSEDVQMVKYVAKVKDIVSPEEADLARPLDFYNEAASDDEQAGFDPAKNVIIFEEGSLFELEDPIPFNNEWIQSLRYTSLGELKAAENTDDIFG